MEDTAFVGIDVSKGHADAITIDPNGRQIGELLKLYDTQKGHHNLLSHLSKLRTKHNFKRVIVAVESTGGYQYTWVRRVRSAETVSDYAHALTINARITHHEYAVQERLGVNDQISALTIAEHVRKNINKYEAILKRPPTSTEHKAARALTRFINGELAALGKTKNQFNHLLTTYLPGVFYLRKSGTWSKTVLRILARYKGKQAILRGATAGFKGVRRCAATMPARVVDAFSECSGPLPTPAAIAIIISEQAQQILDQEKKIAEFKALLIETAPVDKTQVELLTTMPNIGSYLATLFLLHIEDINQFKDADSVVSFFGMNPRRYSSGDYAGKTRLSKQESPIMRREVYNAARRMIQRNNPYMRTLYDKERAKGKTDGSATCVLMHKILRILFGILTTKKPYDATVDERHRQRSMDVHQDEKRLILGDKEKLAQELEQMKKAPVSSRFANVKKQDYELQEAGAPSAESS